MSDSQPPPSYLGLERRQPNIVTAQAIQAAVAYGLTETEIQNAGLYLVQEVSPASDKTVSIALAAYDSRMYEAD